MGAAELVLSFSVVDPGAFPSVGAFKILRSATKASWGDVTDFRDGLLNAEYLVGEDIAESSEVGILAKSRVGA